MPVFPSGEWMAAFCQNLRDHPQANEVASALAGTYRFVIEPAGPLTERHAYEVAITPDGAVPAVSWSAAPDSAGEAEPAPTLTLTAGYDRWRQLIRGEVDVAMAIMLRRLRVGGDLSQMTRHLESARPLLDALSAVDTQWR